MRSSELDLEKYDSDKIANRYLRFYDAVLEPWVGERITLLELGVHTGGSLLLWHDYFPQATIVGIDVNPPNEFKPVESIHIYKGDQSDIVFLSKMANEIAPNGFDIIIDDASHLGELTKISFWHLFDKHLKPSGLYAIEDWGTGYWDDWPDGKSLDLESYSQPKPVDAPNSSMPNLKFPFPCHSYGMVGFVKQLVDEQGARSVARKHSKGEPKRKTKFESMTITPAIIFIKKAGIAKG